MSQALRPRVWGLCGGVGGKAHLWARWREIKELGTGLREEVVWPRNWFVFVGKPKISRLGSRPLPSRLNHGDIPRSLLEPGGDKAIFPQNLCRQELCRSYLLHCSNESFWLWLGKPEHVLHVSTLLWIGIGEATTSCTTSTKSSSWEITQAQQFLLVFCILHFFKLERVFNEIWSNNSYLTGITISKSEEIFS